MEQLRLRRGELLQGPDKCFQAEEAIAIRYGFVDPFDEICKRAPDRAIAFLGPINIKGRSGTPAGAILEYASQAPNQ